MLRKVMASVPDSSTTPAERPGERPARAAVQWLPLEWTARTLQAVPSPSDAAPARDEHSEWLPNDDAVPVVTLSSCEEVEPSRWPVMTAHASLVATSGYVRTHRRGLIEAAAAAALVSAVALVASHSTMAPTLAVAPAHPAVAPARPLARHAHPSHVAPLVLATHVTRTIPQRPKNSSFTPVGSHHAAPVVSSGYVVPISHPVAPSHPRSTSAPVAGIHTPAPVRVHKSPPRHQTSSTGGGGGGGGGGGSNQGPVNQAAGSVVTTAQSVIQHPPVP